ncbi:hypothetical protein CEXT_791241 [Caerostris extrusa]|uniref:Large ribosomal subunit protein P1 n=1 Tax=Caerostris extrusa TaxID=172846 RepID=A0AAV4VM47_CAEEX|nr:hypothetical protein CEXT_791241 [Caerostris extrusa]
MISTDETACVYAALILQDDDIAITVKKLNTILKAAGVDVEPYWPTLFAKSLEGVDVKQLITNVGAGVAGAGGAPGAAAGAPAAGGDVPAAKEEPKKKRRKKKVRNLTRIWAFGK